MLINLAEIVNKYNLNIKGVIQVGCHWAEEHDIFVGLGIENIVYIEPFKESFNRLLKNITGFDKFYQIDYEGAPPKEVETMKWKNIIFYRYACGEIEGEFDMYISQNNQGQSNSLLQPNLHLQQHPEVVFTDLERVKVIPLDKLSFKKEDYNLLVMDVQGAEGLVLKGATDTLKHIDIIYTEVNRDYTYENNMLVDEMDDYLANFGFARIKTYWPSPNWSWGDSIYIKEPLLSFGL
jgi:FkbM family methyltransferase